MEPNVEVLMFIADVAEHDVVVAKFRRPLPFPRPPLAQCPPSKRKA